VCEAAEGEGGKRKRREGGARGSVRRKVCGGCTGREKRAGRDAARACGKCRVGVGTLVMDVDDHVRVQRCGAVGRGFQSPCNVRCMQLPLRVIIKHIVFRARASQM
jgi:hypothetical protein